jgi:hypothetical protein
MVPGPLTLTGIHTTVFGLNSIHPFEPIHIDVIEAIPEVKVTLKTLHTELYPFEHTRFSILMKNIGSEEIHDLAIESSSWDGVTWTNPEVTHSILYANTEVVLEFDYVAQDAPHKFEIDITC